MAHLLPRLTLRWTNMATFKLTGLTAMPKLLALPLTHQRMTAMYSAAFQSCPTHRGVRSVLEYHRRCEVKLLLRRPGRTPKVTCSKKGGEFPSGTLLHVLSLTFFLSVMTFHLLSNTKREGTKGTFPYLFYLLPSDSEARPIGSCLPLARPFPL